MRVRSIGWGLLVLGALLAHGDEARAQERPGHPTQMYSCMELEPGEPVPQVGAGVPEALERQHPGWAIRRFGDWSLPGLELFVIEGARRAPGASERYASVVGVDAAGTIVERSELFARARAATSDASLLARQALAILYRRAGQRPLRAADAAALDPASRAHVRDAEIADGELRFWIRRLSSAAVSQYLHVELATGSASGDF
ncbi:MAG: hypothetical protein M3Y87_23550 [Myxococcota bacterium]|nr:hypothetical protein [Myxococcota bacterium]